MSSGSGYSSIILLVAMILIFYVFLLIRTVARIMKSFFCFYCRNMSIPHRHCYADYVAAILFE